MINLQDKPVHDCLGFCALCHDPIAEHIDVDGRKVFKWKASRREALFKLSNGSVLHVSLCSNCDDGMECESFMTLMESIINGWERELAMSQMDDEVKSEYRTNYYRLQIVEKL